MRAHSIWLCAFLLSLCSLPPAAAQGTKPPSQKEISRELQQLYDDDHQDQADWNDANESEHTRMQEVRRKRVMEILQAGMLGTTADWSNAAWLLQHGGGAEFYCLGHLLSVPPMIEDAPLAGFACAATLDRFLESVKHTEIFSTQTYNGTAYACEPFGAYASMPDPIRRVFALDPVVKDAAKPPKGAKDLPKLLKLAQESAASDAGAAEWLTRTREIVSSGALESDKDYFAAAQILMRSSDADDLLMSHVCAIAAARLKHKEGLRLAGETFDRYLLASKRPQLLGTIEDEMGSPRAPIALVHEVIRKGYGISGAGAKKASK